MEPSQRPLFRWAPQWEYEPKWDGFRCLALRDNKRIELVSKSGKPLTRYFPELTAAWSHLRTTKFVLDGEIVISIKGDLSFDSLLMRIHPSKTRVKRLSQDTPSLFIVFDLLVNPSGKSLVGSLLLGRYDRAGKLDHVGFTSSISAEARSGLTQNWRRW